MRRVRFTKQQIIAVLKFVEIGRTVKDVCREAGSSETSYNCWKAKYGGRKSSDIKKMKDVEDENRHLKQRFADLSLGCRAFKDVTEKKIFKTSDKAWARQLFDGVSCHEFTPGLQDVIAEQDGVFLSARYPA